MSEEKDFYKFIDWLFEDENKYFIEKIKSVYNLLNNSIPNNMLFELLNKNTEITDKSKYIKIVEKYNNLDMLEYKKYEMGIRYEDVLTLRLVIITMSFISYTNNEEEEISLINLVNYSTVRLYSIEKAIYKKKNINIDDLIMEEKIEKWYKLIDKTKNITKEKYKRNIYFIYFSSIVYNIASNSKIFLIIKSRSLETNEFVIQKNKEYTVMYNSNIYDIKLNMEEIIKYRLEKSKPGINIRINIKSLVKKFMGVDVTTRPMIYEPVIEINKNNFLENSSYNNRVWVINREFLIPTFKDNEKMESLIFIDVLNKLNTMRRFLNTEIIKKCKNIFNSKKYDNRFEEKIISEKNSLFFNTWEIEESFLLKFIENGFFYTHTSDRRGRIYNSAFPINPQQSKYIRYSMETCDVSNDLDKLDKMVMELDDWKYIKKNIKNKELLDVFINIKNKIKKYNNILETSIYYVFLQISFLFEKAKNNITNDEILERNTKKILEFINEKEIKWEDIIVSSDEYCRVLSLKKSIDELMLGILPRGMQYIDASGSAFQIHSIFNFTTEDSILKNVGFLKAETEEGVYTELEKFLKTQRDYNKYKEVIDRSLIKSISMPKVYGLTLYGVKETLKEDLPEEFLKKNKKFAKWIWRKIIKGLKKIGIDVDIVINITKKLVDAGLTKDIKRKQPFTYVAENGIVYSLTKLKYKDKINKNNNIERIRTEKNIYFINNGEKWRYNIKRDIENKEAVIDKRKTKTGMYVGMIHNYDSVVIFYFILMWDLITCIVPIHDSMGANIMLLFWVEYLYKLCLLKLSKYNHDNNPLLNEINITNRKKISKDVLKFKTEMESRKEEFKEKIKKILESERVIF